MSNTTGQWCDGNSVELLINGEDFYADRKSVV